jgi:hypothetical protein
LTRRDGQKTGNAARKRIENNILYYVASVLDPGIKTSFIKAQMSAPDAQLIISQVREMGRLLSKLCPACQPAVLGQTYEAFHSVAGLDIWELRYQICRIERSKLRV